MRGRGLLLRFGRRGLLWALLFCNTFGIGAFNPLLPEIGHEQGLADWQVGLLASGFGFARMAAAVPTGALVARHLGACLVAAPIVLLGGLFLLVAAGPFSMLLAGRLLLGVAHTLAMVGGLTALLLDDRGPSATMRLNAFEFAGMLGILGGLGAVAVVPHAWGWKVSLVIAASPVLFPLALATTMRRLFPGAPGARRAAAPPPPEPAHARAARRGTTALMFGLGIFFALSWSGVSGFVIPIRGAREFGLARSGISSLLAMAQAIDLLVLLPLGRIADRVGRGPVLAVVSVVMGAGTIGVGLGPFLFFALGCACFGAGLAGWMLPLGVLREHTPVSRLAWRTGLYRVGVDGAIFLGPLVCGLLGPTGDKIFLGAVGAAGLLLGARLLRRPAL